MADLLLLGLLVVVLLLAAALLIYSINLKNQLSDIKYSKQSLAVRHGQIAEQWIPFSKGFPFPPESFKFLGKPIDGVAFLKDKVVLVEFKIATSKLNPAQRRVRDLVREGKVEWMEYRVE